jgi:hypothetical protein
MIPYSIPLVFFILAIGAFSIACPKKQEVVYEKPPDSHYLLLTNYDKINIGYEQSYPGYLAQTIKEPKKLVYIIFLKVAPKDPPYKKGMVIKAELSGQLSWTEKNEPVYTSCTFSEGSKVMFFNHIPVFDMNRAENVEAEKEEEK